MSCFLFSIASHLTLKLVARAPIGRFIVFARRQRDACEPHYVLPMDGNELPKERIAFRQLECEDVAYLLKSGFPFGKNKIAPHLEHRLLHATRLIPHETGLVAYHIDDKFPVGHLKLVKHTKSLYSIKYVFTSPHYRKMGVASGLLNYAFSRAKEWGGKKVFLNANYPSSDAARLYLKLGFKTIVDTSVLFTGGFPKTLFENHGNLFSLDLHSKDSKQILYDIYKNCMGNKWTEFFETNKDNILNGYSQDFPHFYFKTALINYSANSFALVFHRPPLRKATVELYTSSDEAIPHMLKGIFQILRLRGIVHTSVAIVNVIDRDFNKKNVNLLHKMNFTIQLVFMIKSLV
jgi:GNAT superfamily N-acetyltransferase